MKFDLKVYHYDYRDKIRNLDIKAQGVVKSNKFFPVFMENNKEVIFKPLSKTKPLSTPYFAYSEVFWSTIINRYFDPNTPIYRLAICENIESDFENKYHHGTIVDSIEKPGEKLVNLYEFFRDHPDPVVDISSYVNYCEKFYDYTRIFDSRLVKEDEMLANALATQILLSILKFDQNYHYENVLFKEQEIGRENVAPMIDHEFSSMFLYLDDLPMNKSRFSNAMISLTTTKGNGSDIFAAIYYEAVATLSKNLDIIVSRYKDATMKFLENLNRLIDDLKKEPIILEDNHYLVPFSSYNYKIGHALYKDGNPEEARRLCKEIKQYNPDINLASSIVYEETLAAAKTLKKEIEKRLLKK